MEGAGVTVGGAGGDVNGAAAVIGAREAGDDPGAAPKIAEQVLAEGAVRLQRGGSWRVRVRLMKEKEEMAEKRVQTQTKFWEERSGWRPEQHKEAGEDEEELFCTKGRQGMREVGEQPPSTEGEGEGDNWAMQKLSKGL